MPGTKRFTAQELANGRDDQIKRVWSRIQAHLDERVVGLADVKEQLFICLLCGGHTLLEGRPGLAKTRIILEMAPLLGLPWERIQGNPDVMPSDMTGWQTLEYDAETETRLPVFRPGPLLENSLIILDEVNRIPPKSQATLLEAMAEGQATVNRRKYRLRRPFLVLATQNPHDGGTFRLPDAQADRFMLSNRVPDPAPEAMRSIMRLARSEDPATDPPAPLVDASVLQDWQARARQVQVPERLEMMMIQLVASTNGREGHRQAARIGQRCLQHGAGPRGLLALQAACQARALMHGRQVPVEEDVAALAGAALRHRVELNPEAMDHGYVSEEEVVSTMVGLILNQGEW